jgi:hypothetical protein
LNTVVSRDGDGVRITQSALPEMPPELRALVDQAGGVPGSVQPPGAQGPEKIDEAKGGTRGRIP